MPKANANVKDIFHAALEIAAADERSNFLDQACSDDTKLRAQVAVLLESYKQAGNFLEQCPEMLLVDLSATTDYAATRPPRRIERPNFPVDELLPRQVSDYELLEKIAHGGMGVVYRARQISLNRIVAIKMILSGQLAGQDEVKRFYIEAEAAGKLDHAGIVSVFDVGCFEEQHYYSMAFVDGKSLAARIKEGVMAPREAAMLAKKIADAIQAAHDQGIVHRDLKPGNVLLDSRGEPRITDFGLAKRVEGDSNLTTTGMVLGTPSYMPPEQAAGKEIDAAADVYSLGAILYAMLTGRPPFEGKSQLETLMRVLQEEPTIPRQLDRNIPKDLEAICLKCLEKNAADRYLTATDLSEDLQRFLAGEPIRARNDWRRRIRKWTIREPVLAAHLAVTMVLVAILAFNYWIWQENGIGKEYNFRLLLGTIRILLGWALVVMIFQKAQNVFQTKSVIPFSWAAINPIFMTIALRWNGRIGEGEPLAWLMSLYFLLIVTSCFFRRAELVVITTIFSLCGYGVLVNLYFEESVQHYPSYLVIFGFNLAVVGFLLGLLTLRMKRLAEQNST